MNLQCRSVSHEDTNKTLGSRTPISLAHMPMSHTQSHTGPLPLLPTYSWIRITKKLEALFAKGRKESHTSHAPLCLRGLVGEAAHGGHGAHDLLRHLGAVGHRGLDRLGQVLLVPRIDLRTKGDNHGERVEAGSAEQSGLVMHGLRARLATP